MIENIIKTIAFFDIFQFPLTIYELEKYLWEHKAGFEDLHKELTHKGKDFSIFPVSDDTNKIYIISNNQKDLINLRCRRARHAGILWKKVKRYVSLLRYIPFIKMIAVCNNLAYENPNQKSDIDLFIIIEKKRLWLTRCIITAVFHILRARRHGKKIGGRFCLSFFITENVYDFSKISLKPVDVYMVYWLATLMPVLDYDSTYDTFLSVNKKFIQKHLPNWNVKGKKQYIIRDSKFCLKIRHGVQWILNGRLWDFFERALKAILKKRALKKSSKPGLNSGVIISDDMLKFHDMDRREEYLKKWETTVKKF